MCRFAVHVQAFCGLKRKLRTAGVQLVLCNIRAPYIRRLLAANGVIDDAEAVVREDDDGDEAAGATTDSLFASLDAALNYCEERILSVRTQIITSPLPLCTALTT
jgi:hypothetical protein